MSTLARSLRSPCVPVLPSEQGKCGHIPAILSHPHHGGPFTPLAGSNALLRSTGSVLHCREAQPFGGGDELQGQRVFARLRHGASIWRVAPYGHQAAYM